MKKIRRRYFNELDLTGEYGIGYTKKGEEFYFDLEDYDKVKQYTWYKDTHGYIKTHFYVDEKKTTAYLHRIILGFKHGDKRKIDHKNRNKVDCRKENLRIATSHTNSMNGSIRKTNHSGIIGVSLNNHCKYKKWSAELILNNKKVYQKYFENKEDAIKARLEAEAKYFGEFAPQQHLFEQYGVQLLNIDKSKGE